MKDPAVICQERIAVTYFVRSGDFVKIGKTGNLQSRINALKISFPTDPILMNVCDMLESSAHKIAGELTERVNGEWFKINKKLEEWILSIESSKIHHAVFVLKKRTPKTLKIRRKKVGRPPGRTNVRINISVPCWIADSAAGAAASQGISLSKYYTNAVTKLLLKGA